MSYVIIEGPEGIGKTTLCLALAEASRALDVDAVHIRSRGHKTLDPRVYWEALSLGRRQDLLVIADRGWPSEIVYSRLLQRPSPIKSEEVAGATFESAVTEVGFGIMLVPPLRLAPLKVNDHHIPYRVERGAFRTYGKRWGYTVYDKPWNTAELTSQLIQLLAGRHPVIAAPILERSIV